VTQSEFPDGYYVSRKVFKLYLMARTLQQFPGSLLSALESLPAFCATDVRYRVELANSNATS
jgi:hypothetical protein